MLEFKITLLGKKTKIGFSVDVYRGRLVGSRLCEFSSHSITTSSIPCVLKLMVYFLRELDFSNMFLNPPVYKLLLLLGNCV